jgi:hypothetical protein
MAQRSTEAVDCIQKLVTKGGVNNPIVATTLTRLKFSPGYQAANSAQIRHLRSRAGTAACVRLYI